MSKVLKVNECKIMINAPAYITHALDERMKLRSNTIISSILLLENTGRSLIR